MFKKNIVLLLIYGSMIHSTEAQDYDRKPKLQSITSLGLLNGSKGTALALQTIFGASYRNTSFGLGLGLDYYRYRSVPLFIDLRHEFGKNSRSIFLYGDIGYNQEWVVKEKAEQINIFELENRFRGGLYYDAGVGYKIGFKKSDALLLSAGYSFKKLTSEVGSNECPLTGPCYNSVQTYRYYLSRLVIRAGWKF